jgi:hypothetical protein
MSPVIELFDKSRCLGIPSIRLENFFLSTNEILELDKTGDCSDFCVYIQDGKFGP